MEIFSVAKAAVLNGSIFMYITILDLVIGHIAALAQW
jgi:hypothetical protein